MIKGLQCIIGQFQTLSAIWEVFRCQRINTAKQKDRWIDFFPVKPLQAQTFLFLLEIDSIDFRNYSCASTKQQHKWAINFIDHHTKFVHFPFTANVEWMYWMEVTQYCLTYGYPKKILTDNGKEFDNHGTKQFCKEKWHLDSPWVTMHSNPRTGSMSK